MSCSLHKTRNFRLFHTDALSLLNNLSFNLRNGKLNDVFRNEFLHKLHRCHFGILLFRHRLNRFHNFLHDRRHWQFDKLLQNSFLNAPERHKLSLLGDFLTHPRHTDGHGMVHEPCLSVLLRRKLRHLRQATGASRQAWQRRRVSEVLCGARG